LTAVINYGTGYWQFQLVRSTTAKTNVSANKTAWKLYPNPVIDQLQVDMGEPMISYKIYDFSGKLLLLGNQGSLDISNLSNGIYSIEITSDRQQQTMRFMKSSS
jgi:hypothetical protein